jgi:hypothetical protein
VLVSTTEILMHVNGSQQMALRLGAGQMHTLKRDTEAARLSPSDILNMDKLAVLTLG